MYPYCILRGRIKGTASAIFVIQHRKTVPVFLAIPFMHAISYLIMAREGVLYTEYSTRGTGSREQYSTQLRLVLYCSLDPAPRTVFCIQHSLPCYNYYIQYLWRGALNGVQWLFLRYLHMMYEYLASSTESHRPVTLYNSALYSN